MFWIIIWINWIFFFLVLGITPNLDNGKYIYNGWGFNYNFNKSSFESFIIILGIVLKLSLARRVDLRPGQSGTRTRPDWRKNRVRKNLVWPSWPGQKPIDFFFLLKRCCFDFFEKNLTNPVTQSKPWTHGLCHWNTLTINRWPPFTKKKKIKTLPTVCTQFFLMPKNKYGNKLKQKCILKYMILLNKKI